MNNQPEPGTPIRAWHWLSLLGALFVGSIAAAASWSHMVGVALMVGERSWVAHVLPLSVDGLLLVAGCTLALDKALGHTPRWSARISAAIGVTASLVANVAHAQPTIGARVVAAWPALALYLVLEMLTRRGRARKTEKSTPDVPPTVDIKPVKPQASPDAPMDIPTSRVSAPKQARVAALAEAHPTLSAAELAALAKASPKTVRRSLRAAGPVNGVPFLADVEALPGGVQ